MRFEYIGELKPNSRFSYVGELPVTAPETLTDEPRGDIVNLQGFFPMPVKTSPKNASPSPPAPEQGISRPVQEPALPEQPRQPELRTYHPSVLEQARSKVWQWLGGQPKSDIVELQAAEEGKSPYDIRQELGTAREEEFRRIMGRGLSGLTGGITDTLQTLQRGQEQLPETMSGTFAGGLIDLVGFILGPIKASRGVIGKPGLAPSASPGVNLVSNIARQSLELGLASAMANVFPSLMESRDTGEALKNIVKGGVSGALMGALYPVLGGLHKGGVIGRALSTATGMALLDLMRGGGQFTVDDIVRGIQNVSIDKKQLASEVMNKALDLFFLIKTPSLANQYAVARQGATARTMHDDFLKNLKGDARQMYLTRVKDNESKGMTPEEAVLHATQSILETQAGENTAKETIEQKAKETEEKYRDVPPEDMQTARELMEKNDIPFDDALEAVRMAKEELLNAQRQQEEAQKRAELEEQARRLQEHFKPTRAQAEGEPTNMAESGVIKQPKPPTPTKEKEVTKKKHYRVVEKGVPIEETPDSWTTTDLKDAIRIKQQMEASDGKPRKIVEIDNDQIKDVGVEITGKSPYGTGSDWVKTNEPLTPEAVKREVEVPEEPVKDRVLNVLDALTRHPQQTEYLAGILNTSPERVTEAARNIIKNEAPQTDLERELIQKIVRGEHNRHAIPEPEVKPQPEKSVTRKKLTRMKPEMVKQWRDKNDVHDDLVDFIEGTVSEGVAGGRVFNYDTGEVKGYSSTFPPFFKRVSKEYYDNSLTKKKVLAALKAFKKGKPTENQFELIQRLVEEARRDYKAFTEPPESKVEELKTMHSKKGGPVKLNPEDIEALPDGSKLIIDGTTFTKKGLDSEGRVRLENDHDFRIDVFDPPVYVEKVIPKEEIQKEEGGGFQLTPPEIPTQKAKGEGQPDMFGYRTALEGKLEGGEYKPTELEQAKEKAEQARREKELQEKQLPLTERYIVKKDGDRYTIIDTENPHIKHIRFKTKKDAEEFIEDLKSEKPPLTPKEEQALSGIAKRQEETPPANQGEFILHTPDGDPIARLKLLTDEGRANKTFEVLEWLGGGDKKHPFINQTWKEFFRGRVDKKLYYKITGKVSKEGAPIGYLQTTVADQKYLTEAPKFEPSPKQKTEGKPETPETNPAKPKGITLEAGGLQTVYERTSEALKKITLPYLNEIKEGITNLFAPSEKTALSRTGTAILRGHMGKATRELNTWLNKTEKLASAFDWLKPDKQKEIIHAFEEGDVTPERLERAGISKKHFPVIRKYGEIRKAMMDRIWQELNKRGLLESYIENYVSHIYKDPERAASLLADLMQKRPLSGQKYFLKKRVLDSYKLAEELGLEPKYTNPVELDTAYIGQALKLIRTHDTIQELKDLGFWKFVRKGERPPEGWIKIDDPIANVYFRGKQGSVHAGDYYTPADIGRLLNNMASKGLFRFKVFDGIRLVNNFLNMVQLGASAYHAIFTYNTWLGHNFGMAVSEMITKGRRLKGLERMLTRGIPGTSIPFFIKDLNAGRKLFNALVSEKVPEEYRGFVKAAVEANVDPKLDRIYTLGAVKQWKRAVKQLNLPKAISLTPATVIEAIAKPIMQYQVPWIKLKAFQELYETEMARQKPKTAMEEREIKVNAYNMVEDRFGQMTYDNLFWNRSVKDTLMITLRAVGWNYGDIREVVGAGGNALQIAKMAKEGKIPKSKDINQRTLFIAGMLATQAMTGVILSYLLGQKPESLLDYFAPRTGNKNPDGSDERIIPASYVKDWLAALHESPLQMFRNKMSPVMNATIELINNLDYWGRQIYLEDSSLWEPEFWKDMGKFAKEQFKPFSVQGLERMREHGSKGKALLPMAGFPVAPSYLTRTPVQTYIYETARKLRGTTMRELTDRMEWKRELKEALREKDRDKVVDLIVQGVKNQYTTREGLKRIARMMNEPPDVMMFKSLPPELQVKAVLKANDLDEAKKYIKAMSKWSKMLLVSKHYKEYKEKFLKGVNNAK